MPKRTDLRHVLVIGSGPIVIGQACEFDYSGTQACRVLRAEGLRVSLVNSNPATIMTDPEFADATYVEPITPEFVEQVIARERPDALLADAGRPDRAEHRGRAARGRRAGQVRRRADRRRHRRDPPRRGPAAVQGDRRPGRRQTSRARASATRWTRSARPSADLGLPVVIRPSSRWAASAPAWRTPTEDLERIAGAGPGRVPGARGADRGERARLEGVRARADARPQRQRRGRLLDRERRPDGRAHRRLGHRRAGDDADRPGVPADARPRHRGAARGRRRHRRLQHPVRGAPARPAGSSSSR